LGRFLVRRPEQKPAAIEACHAGFAHPVPRVELVDLFLQAILLKGVEAAGFNFAE
jgi:hypothetical protein